MEIVIVTGGMTFGPSTLQHKSLGGSEQAGLLICKALAKLGHHVTSFGNLPKEGEPDFVPSGAMVDGVRWVQLDQFETFITNTECDLLVVQRDFRFLNCPHQAKKAVLWVHDLATYTWTQEGIQQLGTNWGEVWTVSESHRQQFHQVTGYPLSHIRATRNGIDQIDTMDMGPRTKTLLYAARPERGLEHLVKEGGIMDRLKGKGYTLKVCMYANFPDHMKGYYDWLFGIIEKRDDCEHMGSLTQAQLRQHMRNSFAYVYCTDFEETSCLIARECAEQRLPIIASAVGALPETIGKAGILIEGQAEIGKTEENAETYDKFVKEIERLTSDKKYYRRIQNRMGLRTDLYWGEVAQQWVDWAHEHIDTTLFSRAWSLVQDSDIIPAIALIERQMAKSELDFATAKLYGELKSFYRFLSFNGEEPEVTLKAHYDNYYKTLERPKTKLKFIDVRDQGRFKGLLDSLKDLPAGAKVLDYACGEASQMICLAMERPDLDFYGIDIAEDEVECALRNVYEQTGKRVGETNIKVICLGTSKAWPDILKDIKFDAAMCNEVLEHVLEPWTLSDQVEAVVKPGGRFILTVPQGAWELEGCRSMGREQFPWRAHCWHIDKAALRTMYGKKSGLLMARVPATIYPDGRSLGNTIMSYTVDHEPVRPLIPIKKAKAANPRQTIAAAIICMNDEDTILNMLNSIHDQVQVIQFAQGPSTDHTREMVERWLSEHPWIYPRWLDVERIHPPGEHGDGFGFEDARNASVVGLDEVTDWTLWIDTDEYLSGNLIRYAHRHAFDALAIHQHHFTVDPRGEPTQIDRPARMFRNRLGFVCYGKVHEHFEKGHDNGPGYCHLLQDVDIGHTGYVNEGVRRDRFTRNFPLLEWDLKVNPNRRLGKFLWLRDIVHRMRYHQEQGDGDTATNLAHEGLDWYKQYRDEMDSFGNGTGQAFAYYGECLKILGRGLDFEVTIKMSDPTKPEAGSRNANFSGVADSSEDVAAVLEKMIAPEIEKRGSKYWR